MPTLDDLNDAFDQLAATAPHRLADPVEAPHRHRLLAAGVAAACTAALAVAVPLAVSDHGTGTPQTPPAHRTSSGHPAAHEPAATAAFDAALPAPAAGESPALAYGFTTTGVSQSVIPDEVTRTYQHATISDGGTQVGDLYLFYAGAFDPSTATGGTPVDVDGQPGYYATLTLPDHPPTADALAWQYARDGWGVVTMFDPDTGRTTAAERTSEVTVAAHTAAADVGQLSPMRVPASSGLHVDSLSSGLPDGSVVLDDASGPAWYLGWSPEGLKLSDKPGSTELTIDGHTWIVYRDTDGNAASLGYVTDGWGMTLTPAHTGTLEQMKALAATLEFAPDLTDRSTWFDAADALP